MTDLVLLIKPSADAVSPKFSSALAELLTELHEDGAAVTVSDDDQRDLSVVLATMRSADAVCLAWDGVSDLCLVKLGLALATGKPVFAGLLPEASDELNRETAPRAATVELIRELLDRGKIEGDDEQIPKTLRRWMEKTRDRILFDFGVELAEAAGFRIVHTDVDKFSLYSPGGFFLLSHESKTAEGLWREAFKTGLLRNPYTLDPFRLFSVLRGERPDQLLVEMGSDGLYHVYIYHPVHGRIVQNRGSWFAIVVAMREYALWRLSEMREDSSRVKSALIGELYLGE